MKIRTDFVTNSSSSSFILGFKNKYEIEKLKKIIAYDFETDEEQYVDDVINDIKKGITTKENVIKFKQDNFCVYNYTYKGKEYWRLSKEERESEECINYFESIKLKLNKEFIKKINEENIVSIVEYEDHSSLGCKLEQHIMPYLDNTIERISHH